MLVASAADALVQPVASMTGGQSEQADAAALIADVVVDAVVIAAHACDAGSCLWALHERMIEVKTQPGVAAAAAAAPPAAAAAAAAAIAAAVAAAGGVARLVLGHIDIAA